MGTKQPVAWVRKSSEFGYESSGYQTNVGTKQVLSVLAPLVQSIGNPNIFPQGFPIAVKYKEGENQQHSARKPSLQYFFLFYGGRSR